MKPVILIPLLLVTSLSAQEPDSTSSLFSMREAEHNFAKASVMIGRNAAFAENFAEESVIFTDKWLTNAKQFWLGRKPAAVVLKWEPEFMDIAGSRDFGISTGPWESQEYRPNTEPLSTGYFLTVWKKANDGTWKVILDAGSSTPPKTSMPHSFSFPAGADKPVLHPSVLNDDLLCKELYDREKLFMDLWQKNPLHSSYASFLAPGARLQPNGHLPSVNRDTINTWISSLPKTIIWKTSGAGAASSGDLGFTYGLLEMNDSVLSKGHYVRIWKKQGGDAWKIVLEMMSID
jgi:ketosteroid isomerase-like protein